MKYLLCPVLEIDKTTRKLKTVHMIILENPGD
jgi:hypothetical protein